MKPQAWCERLERFARERHDRSRWRSLQPVAARTPPFVEIDGGRCVDFSSNDSLGLTVNSHVIACAQAAMTSWGAGTGASRLITGDFTLFESVEQRVADFKGQEAGLLFSCGFLANISILEAIISLGGKHAEVFCDRLNHASLHMGCASAGVKQIRYRHNDLQHLEELLQKYDSTSRCRLIISETLFSMDGDFADVAGLVELAARYNALLYLDEAHATGVWGPEGRGLSYPLRERVDFVVGTGGKALGSAGAFITCSREWREYFINAARGFIFSTAMPPAQVGALGGALDIIPLLGHLRENLQDLAITLRSALVAEGFAVGKSESHIVPVLLGTDEAALSAARFLFAEGFLVVPIRPPTVPEGQTRLRISLSSLHRHEHIHALVESLRRWKVGSGL